MRVLRDLVTFSSNCDYRVVLYGVILWKEAKAQSFKNLGMVTLVRCMWFKFGIFVPESDVSEPNVILIPIF